MIPTMGIIKHPGRMLHESHRPRIRPLAKQGIVPEEGSIERGGHVLGRAIASGNFYEIDEALSELHGLGKNAVIFSRKEF